jgi:hypothetical protein
MPSLGSGVVGYEEKCVMLPFARDYAAQARTASGVNILLGISLVLSPWTFDYSGTPAVMNSVIVGALVAILAESAGPR